MMNAMQQYKSVDLSASVQTASPHQLILMLMQGGLEALARAEGAMERKDIGQRTQQINKATAIVLELKDSLDSDKGGELASNLDNLYMYMTQRLIEANRENSVEKVQEVKRLLTEVMEGWIAIPADMRRQQD